MNLQEFANYFQIKGRTGKQYSCLCPAHDDHNASLSISEGRDGKILLKCHAGCDPKDIVAAVGLTLQDLFPETSAKDDFQSGKREIVDRYDYLDKNGRFLFQKTRWRNPDGSKDFSWSHKEHGQWKKGRGADPVLYNLPEISGENAVCLVEGEKDVKTLQIIGVKATTAPDGASSNWRDQYTEALRGKHVYIVQDNDTAGKRFALTAAKALYGAAESVKIIDLTDKWPDLQEHGDITDVYEKCLFLESGAKDDSDYIISLDKAKNPAGFRDDFKSLLKSAPLFDPETAEDPDGWSAVSAADVEILPREWLLKPYFEIGTGTLIQGNNGSGKTYLACALASTITTGKPILNEVFPTETGNVLFLSVEDDQATLAERIKRTGGDLTKCFFVSYPDDADVTFLSPEIERLIQQTSARAVIFDPFQNFLGADVDMHRANETRPILRKLLAMCRRNNCACIIVAHTKKDGFGTDFVNMALGSVDIPGAMRSIIHVTKSPEDPEKIVALHAKCSHSKAARTLIYEITDFGAHYIEFNDLREADFKLMKQQADEPKIPYEENPLIRVFQEIKKDLIGDRFIPYAEFDAICSDVIQTRPYTSTANLRKKIKSIADELQQREKIIVTVGEVSHGNVRGLRVQPYFETVDDADFPCTPNSDVVEAQASLLAEDDLAG